MGFAPNPAVLALPAQGFYVPVSGEQVSALDADVALMFPIGYTLDELKADPLSIPIAMQGLTPQLAAVIG